jgi:biotin carboxyl carrier protein
VLAAEPDRVDLEIDGVRRTVRVQAYPDRICADSALGATVLRPVERLPQPVPKTAPGSLLAAMPGTVVRVLAEPGAHVEEGAVLAVFEAMKMEHAVRTPSAGLVSEMRVTVGQTVEVGDLLAVISEGSA